MVLWQRWILTHSRGKAGLLFQCITLSFELITDDTWIGCPHPAFGTCDCEQPNFRLSESNIKIEAREDIESWQTKNITNNNRSATEKDCSNVRVFEIPPLYPWNNLQRRPIP